MKHKNMTKFRLQAKRVKDLRWQITRWRYSLERYKMFNSDYLNNKYRNRIRYYKSQYEVALKRLKTM